MQELAISSDVSLLGVKLRQDWLSFLDVKPTTATNYFKAVKQFARWRATNNIEAPTELDIRRFKAQMQERLSAASVQLYMVAVKKFFAFLSTRGLYPNVAEHIKGVKMTTEHKRDALTVEQSKRLLGKIETLTVKGKRDKAMIALMLTTGLRSIEVIRADVCDIELWQGEYFLRVQGKGRNEKAERVRLPMSTKKLIDDYIDARGNNDGALFQSLANKNLGGRLQTQTVSRTVKAALRAIGIDSPRLTCHSTRHTFATTALRNGIDIASVSMVLRHKSIETTMIYRHDIDRLNNQAECSVADSILGGVM